MAKAAQIHFGCIDIGKPDVEMFNEGKRILGNLIRIKSNHQEREELAKQSTIIDGAIRLMNVRAVARKNIQDSTALVTAIKAFFLYLNTQKYDEAIFTEATDFLNKLIELDPNHTDILVLK